jgi:hypothetical protein
MQNEHLRNIHFLISKLKNRMLLVIFSLRWLQMPRRAMDPQSHASTEPRIHIGSGKPWREGKLASNCGSEPLPSTGAGGLDDGI